MEGNLPFLSAFAQIVTKTIEMLLSLSIVPDWMQILKQVFKYFNSA